MNCPHCGTDTPPGAAHCATCGAPQSADVTSFQTLAPGTIADGTIAAGTAATIAKVCFIVFLVLFIASLFRGRGVPRA